MQIYLFYFIAYTKVYIKMRGRAVNLNYDTASQGLYALGSFTGQQ